MNLKAKDIIYILLVYLLITFLISFQKISIYLPIIFWLSTFIYLKKYFTKYITIKKIPYHFDKAFIISLAFTIIYFLSGFKLGFAPSPFKHNLFSLLKNIGIFLIPSLGLEIARYIFVYYNKNKPLALGLITVIITMIELNFSFIFLAKNILFKIICVQMIPLIIKNILFTYLAKRDEFFLTIILVIMDNLALIFGYFPNLDWFKEGTFLLLKYAFIYLAIRPINVTKSYPLLFLTCLIVLFMIGIFNYKPIAILSNSMSPCFKRSDIVIYKKITSQDQLEKGTIIVFKKQDTIIIHRIYALNNDYILTKGDNNNQVDNFKITMDDILGIYQFHIKYLGYPSIWLYEYLNS